MTEQNSRPQPEHPQNAYEQMRIEEKRRELWIYLGVGIVSIEALVTVASLCYGFITASPNAQGVLVTQFPFLQWLAGMLVFPSLLVAGVHFAGVGLFGTKKHSEEAESQWQEHLPQRLQKIYLILKGAPVFVILLALILMGVTLATIDGALTALSQIASSLIPYIPHIVGSFAIMVCCFFIASAWLKHKAHRLHEEYAFRREVFERTGVIIVEKNSYALPPSTIENGAHLALQGENTQTKALPDSQETTFDATPPSSYP